MSADHIHHLCWPDWEQRGPESAVAEVYRILDEAVGALIDAAGGGDVMVVSDHGAKGMDGGICINEWLIEQGYLVLHEYPSKPTRFTDLKIDWSRTRAWSE